MGEREGLSDRAKYGTGATRGEEHWATETALSGSCVAVLIEPWNAQIHPPQSPTTPHNPPQPSTALHSPPQPSTTPPSQPPPPLRTGGLGARGGGAPARPPPAAGVRRPHRSGLSGAAEAGAGAGRTGSHVPGIAGGCGEREGRRAGWCVVRAGSAAAFRRSTD